MMRQWAIAVGINQYQHFQPLNYAQRDAQALQNFLVTEAGFSPDRCLLLTDTSPSVLGKPTYPTRENIQSWLNLVSQRYIQPEDILWCFFSGYGVCHRGQDYLVPIEADPTQIETSAIPLEKIFQQLQAMPTENVLLLLDMNRSQGMLSNETLGLQTIGLANDTGIATILSCQPGQFSGEASALRQGFFTAALLESLRYPQCATVEKLDRYLSDRLPQLSEHYWRPIQHPVTISSPKNIHQVILSQTTVPSFNVYSHGVSCPMTHDSSASSDRNAETPDKGQVEERLPGSEDYVSSVPADGPGSTPVAAGSSGDPSPASSPVFSPPQETEETSDAWFWRPVLLWGGIAVAVLSLGVLGRNWTALTQGMQPIAQQSHAPNEHPAQSSPAPASIAARPATSSVPAPGVSATSQTIAAKPTAPAAQPKPSSAAFNLIAPRSPAPIAQPIPSAQPKASTQPGAIKSSPTSAAIVKSPAAKSTLEIARSKTVIKSDQASDYWFAVQEAKKIKPGQPQYAEAQQEIAGWNKDMLAIAKQRAQQKNFDTAILAANLVSQDQPIYTEAKGAIGQWCTSLKLYRGQNPAQHKQAKNLCRSQFGR